MSFNLGPRSNTLNHENSQMPAGKVAVGGIAPVAQRRALGDVSNNYAAPGLGRAAVKPTIPTRPLSMLPNSNNLMNPLGVPAELKGEVNACDMEIDNVDDDPAQVSEYVNDIYRHARSEEIAKTAKFGYMSIQTDINEKMRAILIDWLIEVHLKFKLMPETMYLTVNLIDRYLERKLVIRQKLQLVGVTAMLLASKYEEIYAPEVRDFVYITDRAYSREQILGMEAHMLNALDFRITVPTPFVFLNRFLKVSGENDLNSRTSLLATYFVERSLQEYRGLAYAPSKLAAAGVNMALRTLRGPDAWTTTLANYSGYTEADLTDCIREIQSFLDVQSTSNLRAVFKKYSLPKFSEVATINVAPL